MSSKPGSLQWAESEVHLFLGKMREQGFEAVVVVQDPSPLRDTESIFGAQNCTFATALGLLELQKMRTVQAYQDPYLPDIYRGGDQS